MLERRSLEGTLGLLSVQNQELVKLLFLPNYPVGGTQLKQQEFPYWALKLI